jgi:hypothetical protein
VYLITHKCKVQWNEDYIPSRTLRPVSSSIFEWARCHSFYERAVQPQDIRKETTALRAPAANSAFPNRTIDVASGLASANVVRGLQNVCSTASFDVVRLFGNPDFLAGAGMNTWHFIFSLIHFVLLPGNMCKERAYITLRLDRVFVNCTCDLCNSS